MAVMMAGLTGCQGSDTAKLPVKLEEAQEATVEETTVQTAATAPAAAEEENTVQGRPGDFVTEDLDDGTIAITGYVGTAQVDTTKMYRIPDMLKGKKVTELSGFLTTGFTGVIMPQYLKTIGGYAFYNCADLKSVTLNDGLEVIRGMAFNDCKSLTQITIPDSVTTIDSGAFSGSSLTEVTLPKNLTVLTDAFAGTPITKLTIPGSVTSVADSAFFSDDIEEVDFEEGLESVGETVFYNSPNLKTVKFPASLKKVGNGNFEYCSQISIVAPAGSYAETYANNNGIPCRND